MIHMCIFFSTTHLIGKFLKIRLIFKERNHNTKGKNHCQNSKLPSDKKPKLMFLAVLKLPFPFFSTLYS